MGFLKGIFIAIGILVILAFVPFNVLNEYEATENRSATFAMEGESRLTIDAADGEIFIEGVEGLNEIQVEAQLVTWGNSKRKANENLAKFELLMEQSNGVVTLHHMPNSTGTLLRLRGKMGYGLEVGRDDRVNFRIRVPTATSIDIRSDDGYIQIANITGDLSLMSDDGDVVLNNVEGALDFSSDNGNIEMENFVGSVNVNTDNGDVTFQGWLIGDAHSIHTDDGNVSVSLPASAALEIDVTLEDGDISSDFPLTVQEGGNHFTAALGKPQGRLTIFIGDNGDVMLREVQE